MAKQKQKKVKKELGKLQRAGRYWEWLISVQDQPSSPDLKHEIQEAWKEVQRRTLRSPESFDEFCLHVDKVKGVPDTPDMRFLKALKALTDGAPASDDLLRIKGLSPAFQMAAESLQSKLQKGLNAPRIESLLTQMAREPSKITRKHYSELAGILSGTPLEEPLQILADEIPLFRRLNHKITLKKPVGEALLEDLAGSDSALEDAADLLPASLMKLLLLPFCTQVLLHLQNCAVRPNTKRLQDLFNALESLFPLMAGEKKQDLERALFPEDAEPVGKTELVRMEKDFAAASFEGKLNLLRDLRQDFHDVLDSSRQSSPFPFPFFDDYQDTEEFESFLIKFYEQIFKEIARLSPTLSNRDRRGLPDVMEPILAEDIKALFVGESKSQPMADFLLHAAEAGCMGKRLAMLGILASRWDRSRRVLPLATQALQDAPVPDVADVEWLFKQWGPLVLQSIRTLPVLLGRVRDHEKTLKEMAYALWSAVNVGFFMNTTLPVLAGASLPFDEKDAIALDVSKARELEEIAAGEVKLHFLRDYLSLFPQARIFPENLHKWLELTWADQTLHEYFFETVEIALTGPTLFHKMLSLMGELHHVPSSRFEEKLTGVILDFFKAHVEDFRTMPVEVVERVLEAVLPIMEELSSDGTLLVRLYEVFAARAHAGEREFARISDEVKARMRPVRQAGRQSRSKKRR